MIIRTKVFIDSAHNLNLPYESKCNNLHGHRWQINVEIEDDTKRNDMIIDFKLIKEFFNEYDHCNLNDKFSMPTTAECLAKFWADTMRGKYSFKRVKLTVFETPDNEAEYEISG